MTALSDEPALLRIEEAAERLRVGRSTVYDLIRTRRLRSVKIGRRRLIPVDAISETIATLAEETPVVKRNRNNGEGTIYQRKDGRWEGATYVTGPDGARRRKRVYGATREEVAGKLAKLLADEQRGIPTATASPKVGEYLEYWLKYVVSQRVRPLTLRTYTVFVREHLIPGLGKKQLHRLTARDVRTFLAGARSTSSRSPGRTTKPLSDRTVFHLHSVLRNALQDAVRDDLIPRNVAKQVRISPGHREEIQPLSPAEARKLLDAARDDRLYALYAVALSLGLRRAEALGLAWRDVDLDAKTLAIRQTLQRHGGALHLTEPKTKRSRRTIPLLPVMATTLEAHRERQAVERKEAGGRWREHGLVFTTPLGTPIEPNDFSRAFRLLCDRSGLRRVRLHDLRHTCASLLLAQGVPPRVVMEILGHSSLDVTMLIYGHVMLDSQREALKGMDQLLGGGITKSGDDADDA